MSKSTKIISIIGGLMFIVLGLSVFIIRKNKTNPFGFQSGEFARKTVDPISSYGDIFGYNDNAKGFELCANMGLTRMYDTIFSSVWIAECVNEENQTTTFSVIEVSAIAVLAPKYTVLGVLEYIAASGTIDFSGSLADIKKYRIQEQTNLEQYSYYSPIQDFLANKE